MGLTKSVILHVQAHKNVLMDNVLKSQVILVKSVSEAVMKIMLVVVRHIRHVMILVPAQPTQPTQPTQPMCVILHAREHKNVLMGNVWKKQPPHPSNLASFVLLRTQPIQVYVMVRVHLVGKKLLKVIALQKDVHRGKPV
jgi:hypothetical protein